MKKAVWFVLFVMLTASVFADVWVSGYYKANGTYVAPYARSNPNSTTSDNYSTSGNYNPYTGERGSRSSGDINYNAGMGSFDQHRSKPLETIW